MNNLKKTADLIEVVSTILALVISIVMLYQVKEDAIDLFGEAKGILLEVYDRARKELTWRYGQSAVQGAVREAETIIHGQTGE